MIGAITEQVSENPTVSPTTQPTESGLTPGGLSPANNVPTLGKLQAGTLVSKWVVTIEGCPLVPSDAPSAAVQAAYVGTDFASATVIQGLFVELHNDQRIAPFQPFASQGRCTLKILDVDGSDTFGTFVARRQGGDETTITATVDRNDTTIAVKSTTGFASSGTAYIGTEAFTYTGVTASSFTGCTRGYCSPLGCASSGSGGRRFANHHRVSADVNHIQMNPIVSSIPQQWIGKRVAVRLHTWSEIDQALNTVDNAQLVYTGRIVGITDDPDSFCTVLELEHEMESVKDAIIGKDIVSGVIPEGIELKTGRTFSFVERVSGFPTANVLTVVAGTPASTNEIKTGVYSLSELCDALNRWLGEEKRAARINGYYSFSSPVQTDDGIRTRCNWINNHATDTHVAFKLTMPCEVGAFLGLTDAVPSVYGQAVTWDSGIAYDNEQTITVGPSAPFLSLVFRPSASGWLGTIFTRTINYYLDDVSGTFIDQYASLPAVIKAKCDPSAPWGVFLFDEKTLIVGTYDESTQQLQSVSIAPLQPSTHADAAALSYVGRRADDPSGGPVRIRQVFVIEGTFSELILKLAYSTGTAGYNHETYDALGFGLGAAIPGEILGGEFERSLWNLPNADAPLVMIIDESTKFAELVSSDLNFRWGFVRWKDEHLEVCQWRTPLQALSIATLSESNKAAPAGQEESHRVASQESDANQYNTFKIDYCRDFGFGRKGNYWKSVTFEDQSAASAGGRSITLSLRNTLHDFANTGSSVEAGLADFAVHIPSFSRGSRQIVRSLGYTYFETLQPGDIVEVEDDFARDPLTGARSVRSRSAIVTRVSYDLGGFSTNGSVRPVMGEIGLDFLDTQRGSEYCPSANIDHEATYGGFDAGYRSSDRTIRCRPHDYSHVLTVTKRGRPVTVAESLDASNFVAGDKVFIIERDPADPAVPLSWNRTVESVSGNDIVLTTVFGAAPPWDNTKKYRITYQPYASCQASQQDKVFQADDTDELVQDVEIPYHYSAPTELYDFLGNSTYQPENIPTAMYGDGVACDVGTDAAIASTLDAYIDYKSAHQAPFLSSAMGPVDNTSTTWTTCFYFPWFLGLEHLPANITRYAKVAPFFRSSSAGLTGKVRVAILQSVPVISLSEGFLPGETFRDPIFSGGYAISREWSSTSTTWETGAEDSINLNLAGLKDLSFGLVYVCVQGTGYVQCRGLATLYEGPRVVI